jgi:hypothetical protein
VDVVNGHTVDLTMFQESGDIARKLAPGQAIRIAPAGVDRKPTVAPISGTVAKMAPSGPLTKLTLNVNGDASGLRVKEVARVWNGR